VGGLLVLRPEMVWPLWPGCALLVAVLLLTPTRIWPLLIVTAFTSFVLYDLQAGLTARAIGVLFFSGLAGILVGALGVIWVFGGAPRFKSVKDLAKYLSIAALLAPIAAAWIGPLTMKANYWLTWRISYFTEALALMTITPAILGWVDGVLNW